MAEGSARIRNVNYVPFCCAVALLVAAGTIFGMLDPGAEKNRAANAGLQWVPWALLAGCSWLAGRAWFVGVSVVDGTVIKHGWFRLRRIDVADIRRIETDAYDGWWSRGESKMLRLVLLELQSGDSVRLWELVGRARTARRLADELSEACCIPIPPRSTVGGRHRA